MNVLLDVYERLYAHFGPQHWWPAESPFEVIVGAILTQNTAWANVEKAIANLQAAGFLDPEPLDAARAERIAGLIRPSGYFNIKAKKLKAFVRFLYGTHRGQLAHLLATPAAELRTELLGVYGIGPETADSIVLYAAGQPVFVIDAYTRRITGRMGVARTEIAYDDLQRLFMEQLPRDAALFNEYHALLVALGKEYCKKSRPGCAACPLWTRCVTGRTPAERPVAAAPE